MKASEIRSIQEDKYLKSELASIRDAIFEAAIVREAKKTSYRTTNSNVDALKKILELDGYKVSLYSESVEEVWTPRPGISGEMVTYYTFDISW